MYNICRAALTRGFVVLSLHSQMTDSTNFRTPLSFHAVSFGPENRSAVLRRMVQVAQEVEQGAPPNSLSKGVPSSYSKALDSVSIESLSESLRKLTLVSLGPPDSDLPRACQFIDKDPWLPTYVSLSHSYWDLCPSHRSVS